MEAIAGRSRTAAPPPAAGCALVTRPREDAAALVAALASRGIAAVSEPLLAIRFFDGPMLDLAEVQAVLCTSANGVRALARRTAIRRPPLFAVGAASAAEARRLGFSRVESAAGDARDLGRLAGERLDPAAGRLLHVAGSAIAGDLAGDLRARGFIVERAVLYDACPANVLSAATTAALAAGSIDLALFFSPRTAAIFARLTLSAGLAEAIGGVAAVSISAAADAALGRLRFRERRVAARPNQAALLAALDGLLAAEQHQ